MRRKLRTDKRFLSLSIPISQEKKAELEKNLAEEGCREPITVWNGVIIDGHKRYRFCEDEGIDYAVEDKSFESPEEAVSWVCRKRIPEQNKTSTAYRYLVGRFYIAQKQIYHEQQKLPEGDRKIKLNKGDVCVSVVIGRELNLNRATVERFGMRAIDLDTIAEKSRSLFEEVLLGNVRLTHKEIKELAGMSERKLRELCKTKWHIEEIVDKVDKSEKIRVREKKEQKPDTSAEIPLSVKIKEMPAYDPDMELRGLTLTIPAWIMVMGRAENKTGQATDKAKEQLKQSLTELRNKIDKLLEILDNRR